MVNWTAEKDQELLLVIIGVLDVKLDHKKIADAFGQGTTANSISKRIKRIREMHAAHLGNEDQAQSSEGSDGAAAAKVKGKAGKAKRKHVLSPESSDAQQDDEEDHPSKKVKVEEEF